MPRRVCRSNGQSSIESILLIAGVVGALLMFFAFVRSSVAFRIKTGADSFGHGMLYTPDCAAADSRCPFGED